MAERDDHMMLEVVHNPHSKTGRSLKVTTPAQVLKIHSKEELMAQLDQYSKPFIRHVVVDSKFARKHYLEKVRPALRYYCKKFDVEVPAWLKDDSYYHNLPNEEKEQLFGTAKPARREFRLPVTAQGTVEGKDV